MIHEPRTVKRHRKFFDHSEGGSARLSPPRSHLENSHPSGDGPVIRNSRHSGKAFPDEARERGKVVRVTGAIVDVAKAPKFCKGQRRVDRPEFVGAFRDKAIDKDLPVPWPRRADVLDMEPDVRGAIAKQLVIPLRSVVELVGSFDVIEEKGSGPLRGRWNQVIEIDSLKPEIGAQPHDVALVADDVIELVLPVQTGDGRITLALLRPRLDRNTDVAIRTEVEAHEGVANELWSPEIGEKIDGAQIRKLHSLDFPSRAEIGFAEIVEVSEVVDHDVVTVNFDVRRLGHRRLPVARIGSGDRELPDGHERDGTRNPDLRPPARSHERERPDRTQPKRSR